jgi:protein-L-isoaspartate O-methyltransferase
MLGVTQHLSTDIAAVPMLWVVVLMLYLLTFVVAFSRMGTRATAAAHWLLPAAIVLLSVMFSIGFYHAVVLQIAAHLGGLVVIGLACHGRLAADRPPPDRLTEYYLWIAVGGVLGGAFNSLLAPVLFDRIAEYPIALWLACLFGPASGGRSWRFRIFDVALPAMVAALYFALPALLEGWEIDGELGDVSWKDLLQIGIPAAVAFCLVRRRLRFALAMGVLLLAPLWKTTSYQTPVYQSRTFFGVHRVAERQAGAGLWHHLYHGRIRHGTQSDLLGAEYVPTAYFTHRGPLGDAMKALAAKGGPRRIAVLGLGAGTIAAYGRPDWRMTFYEIDPEVVRIARNTEWFTFLEKSRSPLEIVLGDGRLKLAEAANGSYDQIIIDAFSSDAVPVHLITREAVSLYLEKLAEGGMLVFQISNRYLALERVLSAIAADLDLGAVLRQDKNPDHGRRQAGVASTWVVVVREAVDLGPIEPDRNWEWLEPDERFPLWTDDRSDLLSAWDR